MIVSVCVCVHDNSRKTQPILINDSLGQTTGQVRRWKKFVHGFKSYEKTTKKPMATDKNFDFCLLFFPLLLNALTYLDEISV
jgi:hypothetical protein